MSSSESDSAVPRLSLWTYQAAIARVVDGDTIDVRVDLGFGVEFAVRLRILGVDTAEVFGVPGDSPEAEVGRVHSDYVRAWVAEGQYDYREAYPFVIRTEKRGKYGRYLADVWRKSDGADLACSLVREFPLVADAPGDG